MRFYQVTPKTPSQVGILKFTTWVLLNKSMNEQMRWPGQLVTREESGSEDSEEPQILEYEDDDEGSPRQDSSPSPVIVRGKKKGRTGDKDDKPVSMRSVRRHDLEKYSGSYSQVGQFPVFRCNLGERRILIYFDYA